MAEISEDAAVELLGNVFGNGPAAPAPVAKPVAAAPEPVVEAPEDGEPAPDDEPQEALADADSDAPEPVAEPEFEIDYNGAKEIIKGAAQVKELLQKGRDYSHKTEEVARAREAIAAQYQQADVMQKFQAAVMPDIIELQALDRQLKEYADYDWASAIDQDFIGANKLQMQWNRLKDLRQTKFSELTAKQSEWQQGQAQAAQNVLIAEHKALLAKLPSWTNSETASLEKQAIGKELRDVGYQDSELSLLTDHRAMVVARGYAKWMQLQRDTKGKVKQLRDAPPVNKPGAAGSQQAPNARAADGKFINQFRADGRKGNHRAQETSLERVLSRTFKS